MRTVYRGKMLFGVWATLVCIGLTEGACAATAAQRHQTLVDQGRQLYMADCASCHGASGRGDGKAAADLEVHPADLTRLSRRRGAHFPEHEIYEIIDGRDQPRAHFGGEMPLWGERYKRELLSHGERIVQERLTALIEYLKSIQRTH